MLTVLALVGKERKAMSHPLNCIEYNFMLIIELNSLDLFKIDQINDD